MKIIKTFFDFGKGSSQSVEQLRAHCFECEIDMPVKYTKDGHPYCSNCGLKH